MKQPVKNQQVEVLEFERTMDAACVVTDGQHVRIYRQGEHLQRSSLMAAIAYLETRGYELKKKQLW